MARNPYYSPNATVLPRQRIGARRDQYGNIGPGAQPAQPKTGLETGSLSTGGMGAGHDWSGFDAFSRMNEGVRAKHAAAVVPPVKPTPPIENTGAGESVRMGGHGAVIEYDPTKNPFLRRSVTNTGNGTASTAMAIDPRYGGGTATATDVRGIQSAPGAVVSTDGRGGTVTQVTNPAERYVTPGMKPRETAQLQSDVAAAPTDPAAMDRMKRREFLAQRSATPATPAVPSPVSGGTVAAAPAAGGAIGSMPEAFRRHEPGVDTNLVNRVEQGLLQQGMGGGAIVGSATPQETATALNPASAPQLSEADVQAFRRNNPVVEDRNKPYRNPRVAATR